jgi:flagellar protein FliL
MNKKSLVIGALALVVLAASATAGSWYWIKRGPAEAEPQSAAKLDARAYRYVSLEKVIVLLKATPGTDAHYVSVDLVLRSDKGHEAAAKSDLPMLRSVVVRTLSKYTTEQARASEVEALTVALNKDLAAAYDPAMGPRPFGEAMIAKLIIE